MSVRITQRAAGKQTRSHYICVRSLIEQRFVSDFVANAHNIIETVWAHLRERGLRRHARSVHSIYSVTHVVEVVVVGHIHVNPIDRSGLTVWLCGEMYILHCIHIVVAPWQCHTMSAGLRRFRLRLEQFD